MAEIEDRYYSMPEIMKYLGISQRYRLCAGSQQKKCQRIRLESSGSSKSQRSTNGSTAARRRNEMIELKNINKTFKVAKRNAGFSEAVKALFKKEYTYINALQDVSFKIDDGEMVGYIGPNGAGKSSTIKIMSGILTPDSGECIINGRNPWKERISHVKDIGVVFGQRSQLWWDVPVIDSFELLKDIYKNRRCGV